MITSKEKYQDYLNADKLALNLKAGSLKQRILNIIYPNYIWKFQKKLRKLEYIHNCKSGIIYKLYYYYLEFSFRKLSLRLGFSIPKNVFGPGLAIVHYGTIVVNEKVKVGKNCRIHACTNIGASGIDSLAPQIGDNVYIGPGAIIYGGIKIGDGIAIGANSTVNRSFEECNILIAGTPAKKVRNINIRDLIRHLQ